jgi:hypothetical protein
MERRLSDNSSSRVMTVSDCLLQSADRRRAHPISPGDRALTLAGLEPSERFLHLEAVQPELGAELRPRGDRPLAALPNAILDQFALELGDSRPGC